MVKMSISVSLRPCSPREPEPNAHSVYATLQKYLQNATERQRLLAAGRWRRSLSGCAVAGRRGLAGQFLRDAAHDAFRDRMRGGQNRQVDLQQRLEHVVALAQVVHHGGGG